MGFSQSVKELLAKLAAVGFLLLFLSPALIIFGGSIKRPPKDQNREPKA